jgi:hypothetical protein
MPVPQLRLFPPAAAVRDVRAEAAARGASLRSDPRPAAAREEARERHLGRSAQPASIGLTAPRYMSEARLGDDPARVHRIHQCLVVALVLVGVGA